MLQEESENAKSRADRINNTAHLPKTEKGVEITGPSPFSFIFTRDLSLLE
jgi:hypothetical protein